MVDHGGGVTTRFGHLSRFEAAVGDRVGKGAVIGYVGNSGRTTGPHLHYEVRIDGKAVDPRPFMVETEAQEAFRLAMGPGGMGGGDDWGTDDPEDEDFLEDLGDASAFEVSG